MEHNTIMPTVNVRFLLGHTQKEGWHAKDISVSYNNVLPEDILNNGIVLSECGAEVYEQAASAADYANEREKTDHAI